MEQFELKAEPRTTVGKGASRRLRRAGKVPGIVYGTSKGAMSIQFDHDDLAHHLEREAFYSHVLTLKIGKTSEEVVLRDLQRHPHKPKLVHIDLQRIKATEKITMRVPLHVINEENCPGVKDERGIINTLMSQLEVICLPKDLPEFIEADMDGLNIGDSVQLNELKLPSGVELEILVSGGDPGQPVLTVQPPAVEEVDEVEEVQEEGDIDETSEVEPDGPATDSDAEKTSDE